MFYCMSVHFPAQINSDCHAQFRYDGLKFRIPPGENTRLCADYFQRGPRFESQKKLTLLFLWPIKMSYSLERARHWYLTALFHYLSLISVLTRSPLQQTTLENIVTKGEINQNEQFLPLPQCFQLIAVIIPSFIEIFCVFV